MLSSTVRLRSRSTNNAPVLFIPSAFPAMAANPGEALPVKAAIIMPFMMFAPPKESGGMIVATDK